MPRRRQLSKDRVLETAADLAEQSGGVDEVTLTALAGALDVRVPSLYNHIHGIDGLRDDLALLAVRQLVQDLRSAAFGRTGLDALWEMAHAYRAFAHAHPALYPLTTEAPEPDDTARQELSEEWLQYLLLVMASLGLAGDEALHAIRGFRALLHGFVSLETGGGYKMALGLDESFDYLVEHFMQALES